MSSNTTPLNRNARIPPNDDTVDTPFSPIIRLFSRRTPSFSSSSTSSDSSRRSSSCRDDSPLFTPSTPLWSSGIPFSWEKLPGIPKRQLSKKKNPSLKNLLPLPPAGTPPITPSKQKAVIGTNEIRDPFFAALIECSKDDDKDSAGNNYWKGSKITRTVSDRFGFIGLYTSCKRNCSVSESIIYVPRSRG
ncbi:hypothetical protein RHSIM_Rhsim06G0094100 [Rhododendron simsii]|uniref:Uncharacterized protein n=1 Tax=Rhododendron simsii TaxID=118357 RepID=A0A834GV48_RHOSS|nr:hypothetical protein RHSIM_Rhsim06G0094100 [Rhododendron simsii]